MSGSQSPTCQEHDWGQLCRQFLLAGGNICFIWVTDTFLIRQSRHKTNKPVPRVSATRSRAESRNCSLEPRHLWWSLAFNGFILCSPRGLVTHYTGRGVLFLHCALRWSSRRSSLEPGENIADHGRDSALADLL